MMVGSFELTVQMYLFGGIITLFLQEMVYSLSLPSQYITTDLYLQPNIGHTFVLLCTVQADELLDITLQRSGNPGYVDGEPLLAGVLTDEYP